MTASIRVGSDDLERRDTGQNFQADLLINARTVGPRTTKFSILGGVYFSGVTVAPTTAMEAHSLPNFWVSLLLMHTPFDAELPNLTFGEGDCF